VSNHTLGHAADQPALDPAASVRAHDDQVDIVGFGVFAYRLRRRVVGEHRDLYVDVIEVLIA
jgi:hypothetical protein